MSENTTDGAVHISGQMHAHPAVRRLARACIALIRWQRQQPDSSNEVVVNTTVTERVDRREASND